jgi:phosphomethylpyrimidine synthase
MTEPTTEAPLSDTATTAVTGESPAHNRRKVYVDGPDGTRVPFTEVSLSDSPGRGGPVPNPPVRLYDTSGPGSVPTVGLPPLRGGWIASRGDVEE